MRYGCDRSLVGWIGLALILGGGAARAQSAAGYTIRTVAGNQGLGTGYTGDGGSPTAAQFSSVRGIAVDSSGNVYVADEFNNLIRKVNQSGGTISTVVGDNSSSTTDTNARLAGYSGDKAAATSALIDGPTGVTVDSSGNLFIADMVNNVIRQVDTKGIITTVAGNNGFGQGYSGDNQAATNAQLNKPTAVAVDSAGNLYIADTVNNRIRKVTASTGFITTIGGQTTAGSSGNGGAAINALLNAPQGIAVDAAGNVYFADSNNHQIRKINTAGIVSAVAGNGVGGFSGDGGLAISAELYYPKAVALDAAGNMYIADYTNQRIRKVGVNGIIETIAGTGRNGYSGDGGPAIGAQFSFPIGVAVDKSGNVYVADTDNYVVRELTPTAPAITPNGVVTASAFGDFGAVAPGSWVEIYGSGLALDARSWKTSDFNGVNAPTGLDGTTVTIAGQLCYVDYISPPR